MQAGRGLKPEKLDKVLGRCAFLVQDETPLLMVKCNNFRPLVDALLVTDARVVALQTSDGQDRFVAFFHEIAGTAYDPKKRTVQVDRTDGATMTFKQVHPDGIPTVEQLLEGHRGQPIPQQVAAALEARDEERTAAAEAQQISPDHPLAKLSEKARKKVSPAIQPGETVVGAYEGEYGALVATSERILIAKWGITSGAMFSTQINSWGLKQVSGIEARSGMTTHALVVQASGNKPVTKFGRFDKGPESAHEAPNALLFPGGLNEIASHLRALIAQAHEAAPTAPAAPAPVADPADQIRALAQLRDEALITEDEFAAKKRQILGL